MRNRGMARVSPLLLLGWAVAQPERRPTLSASSADHRPPPHTLAHEGDFDAIASEIRSDLKEIEASTAAATHGPSASHNAPHAGTLLPLDVDAIDNDPDHVLHDLRKLALELEALAPDERPSLKELERERSAMMNLKKVLVRTRKAMKNAGADKDIDLAFSGNVKIAVGGGIEIGFIGAGIYIEINVEAGGTGTVAATASVGGGGEGLKKLLHDALIKALGVPSDVIEGVSTEDQAFFTEPLTFVGPVNPMYEHEEPEASDVVRSCTAESTDVFNEFGPAEEEEGDGDPENTAAVNFPYATDLAEQYGNDLAEQYGTVSTSAGVGAEVQAKLLARVSVSLVGGFATYFCDFHTAVSLAADTPLMNRLNELGLTPALNLDPRWDALLNGFEGTWNSFKADACRGASMYFFVRRLPGAAIFLRGRYAAAPRRIARTITRSHMPPARRGCDVCHLCSSRTRQEFLVEGREGAEAVDIQLQEERRVSSTNGRRKEDSSGRGQDEGAAHVRRARLGIHNLRARGCSWSSGVRRERRLLLRGAEGARVVEEDGERVLSPVELLQATKEQESTSEGFE